MRSPVLFLLPRHAKNRLAGNPIALAGPAQSLPQQANPGLLVPTRHSKSRAGRECSGKNLRRRFLPAFAGWSQIKDPLPAFAGLTPAGQGQSRLLRSSLPGRLRDPRNLPPQSQPAEAKAANAELAQVGARPSAQLAAVVPARGELGLLVVLGDAGCSSHRYPFLGLSLATASRIPRMPLPAARPAPRRRRPEPEI